MKILHQSETTLVTGGVCTEAYEASVPLTYLPIVASHVKNLNKHKFDANAMLQELSDAGLDIRQVSVTFGVYCMPTHL